MHFTPRTHRHPLFADDEAQESPLQLVSKPRPANDAPGEGDSGDMEWLHMVQKLVVERDGLAQQVQHIRDVAEKSLERADALEEERDFLRAELLALKSALLAQSAGGAVPEALEPVEALERVELSLEPELPPEEVQLPGAPPTAPAPAAQWQQLVDERDELIAEVERLALCVRTRDELVDELEEELRRRTERLEALEATLRMLAEADEH